MQFQYLQPSPKSRDPKLRCVIMRRIFGTLCVIQLVVSQHSPPMLYAQESEHPVVVSIKRNPPRSPVEVARTILYLSRINQWKEIGTLVDQIPKISDDPTISLAMVRAAGMETWLRLSKSDSPLNEQQKTAILAMIQRATDSVRDDKNITTAIKNLRSPELVERKRGVLALQAAGDYGLSAIIDAAARSEEGLPSIASEALVTFGDNGKSALKAALSNQDVKAFARTLELAARIPGSEYVGELSAGYFILDRDSPIHGKIEKALSPSGQPLPSIDSVLRYLGSRLKSKLSEYRLSRVELSPAPATVWKWQSQENRLESRIGVQSEHLLAQACELASLILRLPNHGINDAVMATVVLLEQSHRDTNLWIVEDPFVWGNGRLGKPYDTSEFMLKVLEESRRQELAGAELRAIQISGKILDRNIDGQWALVQYLTRLSMESAPPIRYAAALALDNTAKATEDSTIAQGLSRTRAEMLQLESNPLALIVGGSADLRDTLSNQLSTLEVRSDIARNAREAIRMIQEPLPFEMIFVVDRVADMSLSDFLQRIRAAPRTASIPIVMMAPQWTVDQQRLFESEGIQGVLSATLTGNISFTAAVLRDIKQTTPIPAMDPSDRITLRSIVEPMAKK